MTDSLIHYDDKHISTVQLQMIDTRDTHIPSFIRPVYYHTRGHAITARVISGWVGSDWVSCRCRLERCMWLLKLMDLRETGRLSWGWNCGPSYVGLPKELQVIRLLLDQQSKAEFEWMSYSNLRLQVCIPSEFLVNPNIRHVKRRRGIVNIIGGGHDECFGIQGLDQLLRRVHHLHQPPYLAPHFYVSALSPSIIFGPLHLSPTILHADAIDVLDDDNSDDHDGGDKEEEQLGLQLERRRNPSRNQQPPRCGTHSARRHR
ncbi:hypothetical protein J1N35_041815 [Gossypium stocksii]|uniref:Aminotransferase-like plant mobile domain-containing protein n=1 Tax=Gossypium stocksii TaxID=47602 RepID=A0A9D3UGG7_9ROSI|nr:hypothetical protein J1N35_041815 [Gossypium stocksii]